MDLQVAYSFLNFWIGKSLGAWYPPPELDALVDKGQLSYYKDCFIKYGTGQRLTDALAVFKQTYAFTASSGGLITTPSEYLDLISIYTNVTDPVRGLIRRPVPILNEDEITGRTNSQVIPMTVNDPFGEIVNNWNVQLYPQVSQPGVMSYFARPTPPVFVYTVVSGRVIVYNQGQSTQLQWSDDETIPLLIKTLESIGINLKDGDITQWADAKDKEDIMSTVKS